MPNFVDLATTAAVRT